MQQEPYLTKPEAVLACVAIALFYVAILYAPTVIIRLSPACSLKQFLIRRFICAAISSVVSIIFCALVLPVRSHGMSSILAVLGFRLDHIWQAVFFPLFLTSLMYTGSLIHYWKERSDWNWIGGFSFKRTNYVLQSFVKWSSSANFNALAWRNYVVAPLTEELVFRACIIPLLLCGGFKIYSVIFVCPVVFSLAHLNHLMEIFNQKQFCFLKSSKIIGFQLVYTAIFGAYASFLLLRTGHILSPLCAHIFCNFMGLPVLFTRGSGVVCLAFAAGMVSFFLLLLPITRPGLYNEVTDACARWHGYCLWN